MTAKSRGVSLDRTPTAPAAVASPPGAPSTTGGSTRPSSAVPKAPQKIQLPASLDDPAGAWEWVLQLERLAQSGVMAAGFASSVLNALTAVAGTCQLGILERDPARVRDALARAGEIAMRAAESTNVFLTFVRPPASFPTCLCATVVDDALRFVAPAVRSVSAVVDVDVPNELSVACDRARLLQALIDSLVFLLRVDGEPGVLLRVVASRDGDEVMLRIHDDGAGLDPETAARAFEPFLHGVASATGTTPLGERAGLGLFLTKRVVEEMGGRIDISPGAPRGTVVSMRLPAAKDDASSWRQSVLGVDDNAVIG